MKESVVTNSLPVFTYSFKDWIFNEFTKVELRKTQEAVCPFLKWAENEHKMSERQPSSRLLIGNDDSEME